MNAGRFEPYNNRDSFRNRVNNRDNVHSGFHGGGGGGPSRHGYHQRHPRNPRNPAMREAEELQHYDWQTFQMEESLDRGRLPPMNKTPPKRIQTIIFPETPCSSTSIENRGAPAAGFNLCATWLAKNQIITRQKKIEVQTIVVDDDKDDSVVVEVVSSAAQEDEDDLIVIEEKIKHPPIQEMKLNERMEAGKNQNGNDLGRMTLSNDEDEEEAESDSDESIIIIEPFGSSQSQKKGTMTQLESKMVETRWSTNLPSSSAAATNSMITSSQPATTAITNALSSTYITQGQRPFPMAVAKKLDGFSKECSFAKRGARQWNKVKAMSNLGSTVPTSKFTVCSYNVLCQKTIARTGYLYKHLNNFPQFLEWNHRWAGLQEEFAAFDADILGLQEVQADHYIEHFEPFMKQHGYEGVYKQKFGTLVKDDGCAIFYRPEKFERVGYQEVNYFISPSAISNRENIAQILALRCRVTGEVVLVANTHLLFNEERGDVKLAQLAILFSSITQMRSEFGAKSEFMCSVPSVLLMGDFNMECNSLVYDFVVKGIVHVDQQPVRTMSGQSLRTGGRLCNATELLFETTVGLNTLSRPGGPQPQLPLLDGSIRHPLSFASSYHYDVKSPKSTPRNVSTYHKEKAAPDFIFFSKERTRKNILKLQVLERYTLPTSNSLNGVMAWPNKFVPSDHLPLIVKFQLTKDVQ